MILLVDNGSKSTGALIEQLQSIGVDFKVQRCGELPSVELDYSGIILSGRAHRDDASNRENSRVVMEASHLRIPLLGICFGAEIIATTFGGTLRRLDSFRKELRTVSVTREGTILGQDPFSAYEAHGFKIGVLPIDFEGLACSLVCEYEAIKHRHLDLYGVQFHPELSGSRGRSILENFANRCG